MSNFYYYIILYNFLFVFIYLFILNFQVFHDKCFSFFAGCTFNLDVLVSDSILLQISIRPSWQDKPPICGFL